MKSQINEANNRLDFYQFKLCVGEKLFNAINLKLFCCFLVISTLFILSSCNEDEPEPSTSGYICISGNCESVDSGADYLNISACRDACASNTGGYNCISGNCVFTSGTGQYSTQLECQSNCSNNNNNNNTCNYNQYNGADNCNPGYDPVTSSICCPTSSPYYCSITNNCYETCEAADAGCSTTIIKADPGGSSTSGYNCSNGNCVFVSSGAQYSSQSACENNCLSSTGELMVWNSNPQPCPAGAGSTISVYINNSFAGSLNHFWNSAPDCGDVNTVTQILSPGTHSVRAECGTTTWGPSTITVVAGGCSRFSLN